MDKLTNQVLETLKADLKPKMHSIVCQLHKQTHDNCRGCPSHKECKEWVTRIAQYTAQVLIASGDLPKDYEPDLEV